MLWFSLIIMSAPALVFSARPRQSFDWQFGRLILASLLVYVFLNLSVHADIGQRWQIYNECCQEKDIVDQCESPANTQPVRACPEAPNSGPPQTFHLILGWIPAAGYVGLWELLWRVYYYRTIRSMGEQFEMKWISNVLIIFAIAAIYMTWKIIVKIPLQKLLPLVAT